MVVINAEVDIELSDIPTSDLLEELAFRKTYQKDWQTATQDLEIDDLLDIFKRMGCPEELLAPVREWARQPLVDAKRLEQWRQFVAA